MPDLARHICAEKAGADAFARAGMRPADMDVLEIYDSFTITVLLTLEALGFCAPGEGGQFVSAQRTAPGGEVPMNTNGGGLSYAHPGMRSEEHTSELQSLMRISYAVFCLKK